MRCAYGAASGWRRCRRRIFWRRWAASSFRRRRSFRDCMGSQPICRPCCRSTSLNGVPDEIALVFYRSQKAYDDTKLTVPGLALFIPAFNGLRLSAKRERVSRRTGQQTEVRHAVLPVRRSRGLDEGRDPGLRRDAPGWHDEQASPWALSNSPGDCSSIVPRASTAQCSMPPKAGFCTGSIGRAPPPHAKAAGFRHCGNWQGRSCRSLTAQCGYR